VQKSAERLLGVDRPVYPGQGLGRQHHALRAADAGGLPGDPGRPRAGRERRTPRTIPGRRPLLLAGAAAGTTPRATAATRMGLLLRPSPKVAVW
jgi:hypothetical protein